MEQAPKMMAEPGSASKSGATDGSSSPSLAYDVAGELRLVGSHSAEFTAQRHSPRQNIALKSMRCRRRAQNCAHLAPARGCALASAHRQRERVRRPGFVRARAQVWGEMLRVFSLPPSRPCVPFPRPIRQSRGRGARALAAMPERDARPG